MSITLPDYGDSEEERMLESEYEALRAETLKYIDEMTLDRIIMKKVILEFRKAIKKNKGG